MLTKENFASHFFDVEKKNNKTSRSRKYMKHTFADLLMKPKPNLTLTLQQPYSNLASMKAYASACT